MRILIESPNCNALEGSNAAVGSGWVAALARLHECHVVTYGPNYDRGHPGGRAPEQPNVHPHRIPRARTAKLGTMSDFVIQTRRARDRLIDEVRPDIVHSLEPAGWLGPRALATDRAPYVLGPLNGGTIPPPRAFAVGVLEQLPVKPSKALWSQGPRKLAVTLFNEFTYGDTRPARALARRAMRKAERIVLGTGISAGAIPEQLAGRVRRIPTQGIDLDRFAPTDETPLGPLEVIYAGRVTAWKGLHLLIEAVARTGVRLRIYGGASPQEQWYEQHCRGLIERLGASARITWAGAVPREQLAAAYAHADVFAMLSLWEPYATTWIESMACGTPVVGLATGGMVEALQERPAGWLIEPTDPAKVVEHTAALLDGLDRDTARGYGREARALAEERHSWPRLAEMMDAVYRELV